MDLRLSEAQVNGYRTLTLTKETLNTFLCEGVWLFYVCMGNSKRTLVV